jgi:hypothetical protein
LVLQAAVDRNKDVKLLLREGKQQTVLTTAPTGFGDGFGNVSVEGGFHADVYALV